MANEKRLIAENDIYALFDKNGMARLHVGDIDVLPRVDAVEVPCKIGDFVWAIRSFHGHKHPQRGIVSDMFFTKDMKLMIVVKYVARGEWGKTVFATDAEAYAAIGERRTDV